MVENKNIQLYEIVDLFQIQGHCVDIDAFGSGLIHATYKVKSKSNDNDEYQYILQRMNHHIFKRIDHLMENYCRVCDYLKKKVKELNGDVNRETITVVYTLTNHSYAIDHEGNYWRMIEFIPNTITYDQIENTEDFYKTGKAFGYFQYLLNDFDASVLYESIPNFHHTKKRFEALLEAIDLNKANRKHMAKEEIEFILNRKEDTAILIDMLEAERLPLRVTHNDTKISNILLDKDSKEGICVIDLDTIMPGLSLYDFGDAIRSGATHAKEDEADLSKVYIDLELYQAFLKGFIEGSKGILSKKEISMLAMGAKVITLEQAIRFLTDYLDGDTYYKTQYPQQNLLRTRTQIKLVYDMEQKWDTLNRYVEEWL